MTQDTILSLISAFCALSTGILTFRLYRRPRPHNFPVRSQEDHRFIDEMRAFVTRFDLTKDDYENGDFWPLLDRLAWLKQEHIQNGKFIDPVDEMLFDVWRERS